MSESIKEAVILIVTGEKGNTQKKWWRKSRLKLRHLENGLFKVPNFYYAKVYEWHPQGKKRKGKRRSGTVGKKIAYIYWKEGILTTVIE